MTATFFSSSSNHPFYDIVRRKAETRDPESYHILTELMEKLKGRWVVIIEGEHANCSSQMSSLVSFLPKGLPYLCRGTLKHHSLSQSI
jgi:hypothetical protein